MEGVFSLHGSPPGKSRIGKSEKRHISFPFSLFFLISAARSQPVSYTHLLLVEQNARMALSVADRGYVLETGRILKTAPAHTLLEDEDVKKAYLGG